jgi:nitrogenase molybdenum-iron protein alpha chain
MGMPFRQLHSWDYSGPYHGYDGFAVFAKDMDMTLNNPCWNMMQAALAGKARQVACSRIRLLKAA